MSKLLFPVIAAALTASLASHAALVVTVYENAGNTYFEAAGTLNLTGVSRSAIEVTEGSIQSGEDSLGFGALLNGGTLSASIEPLQGALFMTADIALPTTLYLYQSTLAPESFGTGGAAFASQYSGDGSANFGLAGDPDFFHGILLESDSDETFLFSQAMVFNGESLETLGITEGSYIWEFGNGEIITMNVVASTVPEPATWAALIGSAALGLALYRRRRQV